MLIRRKALEKVGFLDPDYFMYYEDVEFCLRAKDKSFKILYYPNAVIWHKVKNSSPKSFVDYYRMRNYLLLMKKYYKFTLLKTSVFGLLTLFERILRIILRKIIYQDSERISDRLFSILRGFKRGIYY